MKMVEKKIHMINNLSYVLISIEMFLYFKFFISKTIQHTMKMAEKKIHMINNLSYTLILIKMFLYFKLNI